jgi:hypothetical protein
MTSNAKDLVRERKRLLLEADAVTRLGGDAYRVGRCLGHDGHVSTAHTRI